MTQSLRRTSKQDDDSVDFANALMTATMEACTDGILVVDASAHILSFNRHFMEMWNVSRELLEAGKDELVLQVMISQVKDRPAFLGPMRDERLDEPEGDELETLDGRTIHRHSTGFRSADNLHLGRVWCFRDISERKAARQQVAALASSDPLTGLANRGAFLDRLEIYICDGSSERQVFRCPVFGCGSLSNNQRPDGSLEGRCDIAVNCPPSREIGS